MVGERDGGVWWSGIAVLFLMPVSHPLLIPLVGVPSHLMWWVHVLPVALVTFRCGRRPGVMAFFVSLLLVSGGELAFGAGYGIPASGQTVIALTVALGGTNLLVGAFALYARRVNEGYRLLFSRISLGVVRTDVSGRVVGANPAAREFLGVERDTELAGMPLRELVVGDVPVLEDLANSHGWSGELEIFGTPGPRVRHAVLAAVADPSRGGFQVIIADRSTEALQELEIERRTKLASLGEALAGVAHELRNPLTAIVAHADFGHNLTSADSRVHGIFEVILEQGDNMRILLDELLGFSRDHAGDLNTDLADVVQRVARVQRLALGNQVSIDVDLGWRGSVAVSPVKLEQVLLNLISNAAHAVKRGGGSEIRITSDQDGDMATIEVSDDGTGIDPAIQERMFEAFETTKQPGEGTGLGLAISRRLAWGWGGDLTARNRAGSGAVFTLRAPLHAGVRLDDTAEFKEPRRIA